MKTADEFLEELKEFIKDIQSQCECYPFILKEIEQFQAQQKQGGNEQKKVDSQNITN